MLKNEILLQGISLDLLTKTLTESVSIRLNELKEKPQPKEEYLPRIETAKILSISLPTLHDWCKKGILNPYHMGNRTYFKRSDIDQYFNDQK